MKEEETNGHWEGDTFWLDTPIRIVDVVANQPSKSLLLPCRYTGHETPGLSSNT
jgi:hypothetical protein